MGQAARVVARKARPCAVVSRCRSFDGAKAAASSATARSIASSPTATARKAWTKKTASQNPPPVADHDREPALERRGIGDVAGLDRPFDAAGIGEGADRIGRRQPGHQPVERALGSLRVAPESLPHVGLRLRGPRTCHGHGRGRGHRAHRHHAPDRTAPRPGSIARRARAACLPARGRGGYAAYRRPPAHRCGDCRCARRAAPDRAGSLPRSRPAARACRQPARSHRPRARGRRRRATPSRAADRAGTRCRAPPST